MYFNLEGTCSFPSKENKNKFISAFSRFEVENYNNPDKESICTRFESIGLNRNDICNFLFGYDDKYEFSEVIELNDGKIMFKMTGVSVCGYIEFFGEILSKLGANNYFSVSNDSHGGFFVDVLQKNEIVTIYELGNNKELDNKILEEGELPDNPLDKVYPLFLVGEFDKINRSPIDEPKSRSSNTDIKGAYGLLSIILFCASVALVYSMYEYGFSWIKLILLLLTLLLTRSSFNKANS